MKLILCGTSIRNHNQKLVELNLEIMKFKKTLFALIIAASFIACKKDEVAAPALVKAVSPVTEKTADY
jgi:hypothetical protein